MADIARYLTAQITNAMSAMSLNASSESSTSSEPFRHPSVTDVLQVKETLASKFGLSLELIEEIIDMAEYWPCSISKTTKTSRAATHRTPDVFILRSKPIGYLSSPTETLFTEEFMTRPLTPQYPETVPCFPDSLRQKWKSNTNVREPAVRKIVFKTKSHDQGWADRRIQGSYRGSYSWFEVGLERVGVSEQSTPVSQKRPYSKTDAGASEASEEQQVSSQSTGAEASESLKMELDGMNLTLTTVQPVTIIKDGHPTYNHTFLPSSYRLQANLVAHRKNTEHEICWMYDDCIDGNSSAGLELENFGRGPNSLDGTFVRSLKLGDVVTIWAHARFPGWANIVEEASIEIYWAV